jgi:hypothetical protein
LAAYADGVLEFHATNRRLGRWLDVLARRARSDGASWASIGVHLNITRQAAQQRYGSDAAIVQRLNCGPVCFAELQRRANRMGHAYLGTEHVLLALLSHELAPLDEALAGSGVDARTIRRAVRERVGTPGPGVLQIGTFSGALRRSLAEASRIGARAGHFELSGCDLLLGMLSEGSGIAAEVLSALNVDSPDLRHALAGHTAPCRDVPFQQFCTPERD